MSVALRMGGYTLASVVFIGFAWASLHLVEFRSEMQRWRVEQLRHSPSLYFSERAVRNIDPQVLLRVRIESLEDRLRSAEALNGSSAGAVSVRDEALRTEVMTLRGKLDVLEQERSWRELALQYLEKALALFFACIGAYYAREAVLLQRQSQGPLRKRLRSSY